MNVFQTITAVKKDLGAVGKNGKMTAGPAKYAFRGVDDIINALHEPMVTHGLVIAPKLRKAEQIYGQGSNGNQTRTIVEFEWIVAGPEGDSFTAVTFGESMDTQDKGGNKSGTSAYKQLLTQLLSIPFETDDPDNYHPDTEAAKPAQKPAAKAAPSSAPVSEGSAKPEGSNEILCAECGYSVGSGPIKRKQGKTFHKECADGKPAATPSTSADDISSIIDTFPGAE